MIDVRNLSKRYGKHVALDDLSFRVQKGGTAALWGMNGAGKTTTMRCILGMTSYSGNIRIGGIDAERDGRRARSLIGYVPQTFPHYDLPVFGLVRYLSKIRGASTDQARACLDQVGLKGVWSKPVRALSGGMKQRLGLAMALLGRPPVLLLDEPTASLDSHGRDELFEILERVRGDDVTVLFSSHRPEEVALMADDVISLDGGRLVSVRPAGDWYDDYVASRRKSVLRALPIQGAPVATPGETRTDLEGVRTR